MKLTNAKIFDTESRSFRLGSVTVDRQTGKITEVIFGDKSTDGIDLGGDMLVPGLVDAHTHGRNGYDFNKANAEEMKIMAKGYLKMGVTDRKSTRLNSSH